MLPVWHLLLWMNFEIFSLELIQIKKLFLNKMSKLHKKINYVFRLRLSFKLIFLIITGRQE